MKTEQRKKEDCELLDGFCTSVGWDLMERELVQFKADNDLIAAPKLAFNRWLVGDSELNWLMFVDDKLKICYGINIEGEWFRVVEGHTSNQATDRYATEEEVIEKLSVMAERMGYVEGVEVLSLFFKHKQISGLVKLGSPRFDEDGFWYRGCLVMQNGKWAKIISTPKTELQLKINELEQKLNELKKLV